MDLIGREESELEYHARVLARAADRDVPVLERVKFLAIFTTLTDEFFQVRLARLRLAAEAGTTGDRLGALLARFGELSELHERLWFDEVVPDLDEAGVSIRSWSDVGDEDRQRLLQRFEASIEPILTPLAVGPAHPFPFISDLSVSLGTTLIGGGQPSFARVKIPDSVGRFCVVERDRSDDDETHLVVTSDEVIGANLEGIFTGREIGSWCSFRVTRNADYEVDDEEVEDLRDALASELIGRRFQGAVRLELDPDVPPALRSRLQAELEIDDRECFVRRRPLGLGDLWELYGLDRPDLKDPPHRPSVPTFFANAAEQGNLFGLLGHNDVLVHHPYDSFAATTQAFVEAATRDPDVLAIKQTLYRTSGDSPIAAALMDAVDDGKQAAVLVELKARFDEEANIRWAEQMESRGVHVVYGFIDLKTHTKTALVVRQEPDGSLRRFGHFGTGNYNPDTANHYEDLGLFTADPVLTADLAELFNMLTSHSRTGRFERLLVAPVNLLERLLALIGDQAHPGGHIVAKMNALTHDDVIEALAAASQAGCEIDLIVRSACRLRPGVEDYSDRIRVRSIVGPVLEHSRIFRFGGEGADRHYYIGSADLMVRNLERRVEAVVPVDDPALRRRLDDILDRCLADNELAWTLSPDGTWSKVPGSGRNVQRELAQAGPSG